MRTVGLRPGALSHYERAVAVKTGGLLLTRAWFSPGLRLEPHAHGSPSVAVVLRGGWLGQLERQDSDLRQAESVVVTPAGARHSNTFAPTETEVLVVEVPPGSEGLGAPYDVLLSRPATLRERGIGGVAARLAAELQAPDAHSPLLSQGLALEILATVGRLAARERGPTRPDWLERARECLHGELGRSWTLASLSLAVGVEPTRLVRAFRRHLRTTPGDYLRRVRVDQARRLLMDTERPIADIALETGFTDQSHLTRVFRRHLTETPAAFRLRARHR
jgi:AraC family transcriptional regulator